MNDSNKTIAQHLSNLVGQKVSGINSAVGMLMIQFGTLTEVKNRKGISKKIGQWALHIQCPWCIERLGEIYVGQSDFNGSETELDQAKGKLITLSKNLSQVFVEHVSLVTSDGFRMYLSGGFNIVATTFGSGEEDWRLFQPGQNKKHLVVSGSKILESW